MKRLICILFLSLPLLVSCSRPEATPELRDPIYQDFLSQKSATEKGLAEAEKKMDEYSEAVKKAAPQTGQAKQNLKKYYEMQRRVNTLSQQSRYWNIRIEERLVASRLEYRQAFAKGIPWPDEKEFATYRAEKKLRAARLQWDQKERVKELKMGTRSVAGGGEGSATPTPAANE